jgi:hypothetical protein
MEGMESHKQQNARRLQVIGIMMPAVLTSLVISGLENFKHFIFVTQCTEL